MKLVVGFGCGDVVIVVVVVVDDDDDVAIFVDCVVAGLDKVVISL